MLATKHCTLIARNSCGPFKVDNRTTSRISPGVVLLPSPKHPKLSCTPARDCVHLANAACGATSMAPRPSNIRVNSSPVNYDGPIQLITSTFLEEALAIQVPEVPSGPATKSLADPCSSTSHAGRNEPAGPSSEAYEFLCPPIAATYLIFLNWGMPMSLPQLWERAGVRICADGGCNRLFDELPTILGRDADTVRKQYLPDLIKGDLDSVRPEVRQYYADLGVAVEQVTEQETTDLMKCLNAVEDHLAVVRAAGATACQLRQGGGSGQGGGNGASRVGAGGEQIGWGGLESIQSKLQPPDHLILVLGALGGRLDHTLANLSTLHSYRHLNIALIGEGNLVRLVRAGRAVIRTAPGELEGPMCGLIPLCGPCATSTTGLKYNMNKTRMEVGGLISACNVLEGRDVCVETDTDVIWTTQAAALS